MDIHQLKNYLKKPSGLFLLGGLCGFLITHNLAKDATSFSPPAPPLVKVESPVKRAMAEYIYQTGNVVAYSSVDLVARVEGYLQAISFTDGAEVKKGQPLFLIEPKPYQEDLNEAKASLSAAKANLVHATAEYQRQVNLMRQNATSQSDLESWLAQKDEAIANVAKAKANLETAEINYSYTHVAAPFDGRIGRHLVDLGNLVGSGSPTTLANIEKISPVYIYFNLNELDLLRLRKLARKRGVSYKDIPKIKIEVGLQNETNYPTIGHLDFVNVGVDASTGTMEFRGIVNNESRHLIPGLFVRIRLAISPKEKRLSIPKKALQFDQTGPFVYTLNDKNLVEMKYVTLGPAEEGYQAISEGLSAKDRIIIEGVQFVTQGKPVRLQTSSAT